MKFKKKTKYISLASILMILIATTLMGAYAYMQKSSDVTNRFVAGTYSGKIDENFPEDQDLKDPVIKEVAFENTGDYDQILRVKYSELWVKDGEVLSNTYNGVNVVEKAWETIWPEAEGDHSDDLWIDGGDGWYYYKRILPAKTNNTTAPILTKIQLDSALDSEHKALYLSADYKLSFELEHVQATEAAVAEVFGKTCTINSNGTVNWN